MPIPSSFLFLLVTVLAKIRQNPFNLIWSPNITSNPNLDEAARFKSSETPRMDYCVYLSHRQQGLVFSRCRQRLSNVICSYSKIY